jgi:O-antigen ligase
MEVFEGNLSFQRLLLEGQQFIPYNTYVPALGLGASICISFAIDKTVLFAKILAFAILGLIIGYTFASSSRQSILFIILAIFIAAYTRKSLKAYAVVAVALIMVSLFVTYATNDLLINQEVRSKLIEFDSDIAGSSRVGKLFYGLSLMSPIDVPLGAGLSSVPDGGPHNDYIRWFQRVGVIGLIGFYPFISGFRRSIATARMTRDMVDYLIACSFAFTLFTSFFGYPREDAFQSPFVFIGPILSVAVRKHNNYNLFTEPIS